MRSALDAIIGHRSTGTSQAESNGVVEGVIRDVTAAGCRFTIPDYDGGRHVFGPAPWSMSRVEPTGGHDHPETGPPTGARCLVVFVPPTPDHPGLRPWVVAWWTP